ncbi:PAS domain-containing protein, partial [Bacteroidota bacterium]
MNTLLNISSSAIYILSISGLIIANVFFYFLFMKKWVKKYSNTTIKNLLEQQDMFRKLFDHMPYNIYFKDTDSHFIFANKKTADTIGVHDPEELYGKTDFDFFDEHYAREYAEDEQHVIKNGIPLVAKLESRKARGGKETYYSSTKIPVTNEENEIIGIIGIGENVSDRIRTDIELQLKTKKLEESNQLLAEHQQEREAMIEELHIQAKNLKSTNAILKRLSLVASHTENTVVIMDGNGNLEWVNDAFKKMYSKDLQEFCEERGWNIRDNSQHENISGIINQIYITRKPFSYNSKYKDESGKIYWHQTNITPIVNENGIITNLILIDSDISQVKEAETKINEQNRELEKRASELRKLNATKNRLFSIIAHDLRNPFNTIRGFTELLQERYKNMKREEIADFLGFIHDSTGTAIELLENLMEWATVQSDRVQVIPEILNIYSVIEEIIALQNPYASKKSITLANQIQDDLEVKADLNMMRTVLRNLSNNGIKFSNEGGIVT